MLKVEEQDCFTLSVISQTFYLPASLGSGKHPFSLFPSIYAFSCTCGKGNWAMT